MNINIKPISRFAKSVKKGFLSGISRKVTYTRPDPNKNTIYTLRGDVGSAGRPSSNKNYTPPKKPSSGIGVGP